MRWVALPARNLLAFAALALLVPACGGKEKSSAGVGSSTAASPLFTEEFSKAFPGTGWSTPFATGSGTSIRIDAATGDPAPSLALTTTQSGSFVGVTSTMSFASLPSTFSVQMSATGSGEGSGGMAILDHAGVSVAAAEWHAATPSALTFRILGTVNASPVAVPLPGSGFHQLTFSVDSLGNASWSLDDSHVMSLSGFPTDMLRVQIYDNIGATGTSFSTFRFDNLTVSSP